MSKEELAEKENVSSQCASDSFCLPYLSKLVNIALADRKHPEARS